MKAAVYFGREDIRVMDVPEPTCGINEILVKIELSGICGTDLHEYMGGPYFALPGVALGHEFSGTIIDMGSGVTGFSVGDRVAGIGVTGCEKCYYCRQGLTGLCSDPTFIGLRTGGALAALVAVPASAVFHVPESLSMKEAALLEPLGVAFHAVRRGQVVAGETVFVAGAGPIGLGVIQAVRASGASEVIVCEVSPRRRQAALELGATCVIDPTAEDAVAIVHSLTFGRGVDICFDTAGVQKAFDTATGTLRKRGRFVMVAAWEKPASFDLPDYLLRELEFIFSFSYEAENEIPNLLKLMARGDIKALPMISAEIALDSIVSDGFEELRNNREGQVKILVNPSL